MKKISVFVDENAHQELKKLPGTISEHIRTAIDEFLESRHNVSTSPTIIKEDVNIITFGEEGDSDEEEEE